MVIKEICSQESYIEIQGWVLARDPQIAWARCWYS